MLENQTQEMAEDPNSLATSYEEDPTEEDNEREIDKLLASKNIADSLSEEELNEIGEQCRAGFEMDKASRSDWERDLDEWLRLAMQVRETKSFPWPKASNVKYPLLSTAAMQFAARAYPSLVPSDGKVVKCSVIGKDPDGQKRERGDRVAAYMSYQVMHEMDNWEEDMDKLLMMLPIVGTVFKKTFYSVADDKVKSYLISPRNLIVNYWAKDLECAERVSEIIEMPQRILVERQKQEIFRKVDLGSPSPHQWDLERPTPHYDSNDISVPYILVEQHTYLDLDGDGYTEPYIVTFDRKSGEVLRIVARFTNDNIRTDTKGKITSIKPDTYYTKFSFVPNPDGSFYALGFGLLLGPLNESVNSIINQLVDSGTLNNLQGGFIGKGLRIKMGDSRFNPGEWKPVNATADDLRKQIVPLPSKEPSNVLFQLMGSLITSGKELASVAEIFTGKMPGQNTPATTTMASVEQGMKVFTAVYKRIFRSLATEFKRIQELNNTYLDPNTYVKVIDTVIGPNDFSTEDYDICPGADPNATSAQEKLMKAQGLLELLPTGILDPVKVITRVLEAQEQPNWQDMLSEAVRQSGQMPEPPPDPKLQEMQMKGQLEQQKMQLQAQAQQHKMELETRDKQTQLAMKAQEHAMDMEFKAKMAQIQQAEAVHKQRIFSVTEQAALNQKMVHGEQLHQQKLTQAKETAKLQAQKSSQSGERSRSQKPSSKK